MFSICLSKLKIKPQQITVQSSSIITIKPFPGKESLDSTLRILKENLPHVVIKVEIKVIINVNIFLKVFLQV